MFRLTPTFRLPLMIATACAAITVMTAGSLPARAQTNQFQTVVGGTANDRSEGGIITTADNHMIMVGTTSSFAPEEDVYVAKIDVCGNVLWARTYDIGRTDIGRKIRRTPNGGFVIVGSTETVDPCCGHRDAFLLHIDANGNVVWTRRYGQVVRDVIDDGRDLRIDPATGDIYATGFTNVSGSYEGWIWKVNSAGTLLWSKTYGSGTGADLLYGVELVCDDALIAVGSTTSYTPDGNMDVYMVKVDRATGNWLWTSHRGDETNQELRSVTIDESGIVAAGGRSEEREYVETVDCTQGFTFFENTIGDPDPTLICEVNEIKAFNGSFYIVGSWDAAPPASGLDIHVSRLGITMSPIQTKFYGGSTDDWGFSITPTYDPDINGWYDIAVAGTTNSFGWGNLDMYAIGTDWLLTSGCNEMEKPYNELDPPSPPPG